MPCSISDILQRFKNQDAPLLQPEQIQQACWDANYSWRERLLGPVQTIYGFFRQILHANAPNQEVTHLVDLAFSASAWCQAKIRLPLAVFQDLLRSTTHILQEAHQERPRWKGRHRTLLIDGSTFSTPDTEELARHFGYPAGQRAGCGFPVAHVVAAFHSETGLLLEILPWPPMTCRRRCKCIRISRPATCWWPTAASAPADMRRLHGGHFGLTVTVEIRRANRVKPPVRCTDRHRFGQPDQSIAA